MWNRSSNLAGPEHTPSAVATLHMIREMASLPDTEAEIALSISQCQYHHVSLWITLRHAAHSAMVTRVVGLHEAHVTMVTRVVGWTRHM